MTTAQSETHTRTDVAYDAFLWRMGKMVTLGVNGVAYAINNHNQVVGTELDGNGHESAFLWQGGKATVLTGIAADDGAAYAINDSGEVVGASGGSKGVLSACIWRNRVCVDLNGQVSLTGWRLSEARGINSRGQIVGVGEYRGRNHAFLLTPVTNEPKPPSCVVPSEDKSHVLATAANSDTPGQTEARRITVVTAVTSPPTYAESDIECRSIVQAVWPLPQRTARGDLAFQDRYASESDHKNYWVQYLAHDGQSNILIGLRLTNRSRKAVYFHFVDCFAPDMTPLFGNKRLDEAGNNVPPYAWGLLDSPLIAPGESFTLTRPARLSWYGNKLVFVCMSVTGRSYVSGLKPGRYEIDFPLPGRNAPPDQRPFYRTYNPTHKTLPATIEIK